LGYSGLISPGWVAGIQVEGTLSDMIFHAAGTGVRSSASSSTSVFPAFPEFNNTTTRTSTGIESDEFAVKMHWSTSAIARLGWLVTHSTLLYGTGGATYAGFGDGFDGSTFRAWGWSVGGGVEQKLGSNWSVRVEYRFTDFQHHTASSQFTSSSTATSLQRDAAGGIIGTSTSTSANSLQNADNFDPQMHTIRLGIAYTFN
jgi:outer membrane immunogenic protein